MRPSVQFGCAVAIIVFVCCGGRTGIGNGETDGAASMGNAASGGVPSWGGGLPLLTGGSGNGGSATTSTNIVETYCGGIFAKKVCGLTRSNGVDGSMNVRFVKTCDIELPATPASGSDRLVVVVDCSQVPLVREDTPDVGGADGFYINYMQSPAHLRLTGSYCDTAQSYGVPSIDVMAICGTTSLHGCACRN